MLQIKETEHVFSWQSGRKFRDIPSVGERSVALKHQRDPGIHLCFPSGSPFCQRTQTKLAEESDRLAPLETPMMLCAAGVILSWLNDRYLPAPL